MVDLFDCCISNPPYQSSTGSANSSNNSASNIFQNFYCIGIACSKNTCMIFPGGRWMQRTARCRAISDLLFSTMSAVEWFPNGGEKNTAQIFENVVIRDGVSIVKVSEKDFLYDTSNVNWCGHVISRPDEKSFYPLDYKDFDTVSSVLKVSKKFGFGLAHDLKHSRMLFGLESTFVERNPGKISKHYEDLQHPIKAKLGNATKGSAKRVEDFFVERECVSWTSESKKVFHQWKVVGVQGSVSKTPSAGGYHVVPADVVTGESLVVVGSFSSEQEAANYCQYLKTGFAKFLLDAGKGGKMERWGTFLPNLCVWNEKNEYFDFHSKDFESQLEKFFGVSIQLN